MPEEDLEEGRLRARECRENYREPGEDGLERDFFPSARSLIPQPWILVACRLRFKERHRRCTSINRQHALAPLIDPLHSDVGTWL